MKTGCIGPSVFCGAVFFVAAIGLAQEGAQIAKEALATKLSGVEAGDIQDSVIPGIYEVAVGSDIAYVTTDGRYLLQGDLYDLSNSINLTEERRAQARISMLAGVDSDSMIIFRPENGEVRHTVTMFTDIDCGFCRQFHRDIDKVNALGIEVRYLFYPRTGPDTDSWEKADKVWCAVDRVKAFNVAQVGGPVPEKLCKNTPVNGHWDLGRLVGVRGTPAIYTQTGIQVGGYMPPDALLARLDALVIGN
ncbi:MAG: DsbC family protein [Gammaproteobacteria bacterium]